MNILITPEDIIKRCLWTNYKKFVLKDNSKAEITKIIEENEITTITEEDAYVVGLLKVIETDNLVHRFRLEMEEFIKIKTTVNKERVIINKASIMKEVIEFIDRFPEAYNPDKYYQDAIDEMIVFAKEVHQKIEQLDIVEIMFKEKMFTYVYSKDVLKMIKF